MRGRDKIRKNKRGIIFTATTNMFFVGLLVFAVLVYQNQEKGEEKILSNSLTTRILNIEDSIQQSVKTIYLVNKNISIDLEEIKVGNYYHDRTIINTTLLEQGQGNASMKGNLTKLQQVIESQIPGVTFNSSALNRNLVLKRGAGVMINKTALNPETGANETLMIYYNYSGQNKGEFYGINITLDSHENISKILNSTPLIGIGNGHYINITINDDWNDLFGGADPEKEDSLKIEFGALTNQPYTWIVNNESNSTTYLNITLDNEKLTITSYVGNYTLSANIDTASNSTSNQFYFEPEVITINIPEFETRKTSRISFR